MIKKILVELYCSLKDFLFFKNARENREFQVDVLCADIFRLVHAIEKGLSIEKPRLGFGLPKMQQILDWIEQLESLGEKDQLCVKAANDAFVEYFKYHDEKTFTSDEYISVKQRSEKVLGLVQNSTKCGGTLRVRKKDFDYDFNQIEKFFKTRHSVRQFTKDKIDLKVLKKSIELAQTAPSACNRQAVRVYVVEPAKYIYDTKSNLEGIGGFTDDVSYFLLITGKLSAYGEFEFKQFAISASFFAAYLSLALHAYKIGACVIQRSIRATDQWKHFCKLNNIPQDEQLVVMLGVGNLKDEMTVPVSKRYDVDEIMRVL